MPRVIFFGSPDFALPSLKAIVSTEYCPVLVVTQPDRPSGRGRSNTPTPVRRFAEESGLPVEVVSSFKKGDIVDLLKGHDADFFVVVAFGLIFPKKVLALPAKECINVHASLLPAYRGASPVNMAIVNGEAFTGVSTMRMVQELDAGPVFMQSVEPIDPMEDAGMLFERLAGSGAGLLLKTLRGVDAGGMTPVDQPEKGVSRVRLLKKEDGAIPWEKGALEVHNHIRGMNPWPGSYTYYEGRYLKVHRSEPCDIIQRNIKPGRIVRAGGTDLVVACGSGTVRLTMLQVQGRKVLETGEFLRGYQITAGERFGEKT